MKHYRYQEDIHSTGGIDPFDNFVRCSYDNIEVKLIEFDVTKETPKGYWIKEIYKGDFYIFKCTEKWVSKVSRKRYAYPTKEEALNSFLIRKLRQVNYLEKALENARTALQLGKNIQNEIPQK